MHFFRQGLYQLGVQLTERQVADLVRYSQELHKWNRKINLIARNTPYADVIVKHFLDSLTLVPVLDQSHFFANWLLDVGSGGGFPGLVVKIARPALPVVLLEPRQRRAAFLNHVIRTLGVSGIEVLACRTEENPVHTRAPFGIITGRAVADVPSFLEMVEGLAGPDTLVVCMQGVSGKQQWVQEQNNSRFEQVRLAETALPFSGGHRYILVFRRR